MRTSYKKRVVADIHETHKEATLNPLPLPLSAPWLRPPLDSLTLPHLPF